MSLFKKPQVMMPPPPPAAVAAGLTDDIPDPNMPEARQARSRAESQNKARRGRASTILTSPTGLQPVTQVGSTLLGS